MKITDEMLREAAGEAAVVLVRVAERDYVPGSFVPSPDFQRRMEALLRRSRRPAVPTLLRRAAAAALVLLLGCGSWLTVDTEAREAFTGWARGVYDDVITYHSTDIQISEKRDYLPGWIPEGYTELFRETDDQGFLMVFRRQDGRALQFGYLYNSEFGAVLFDTTGMTRKTVKVNGKSADLWNDPMGDAAPALVWEDGYGQILYVSADLTEGELIRFAEMTNVK